MDGKSVIDAVWILVLIIIAWKDGHEKRIPDILTIAIGLCAFFRLLFLTKEEVLLCFAGMGISLLLFFVILFCAPGAFGGGDIKLSVGNGLYLGMENWLRSFAVAVFAAGIFILYQVISGKETKRQEIAFGPFLCVGAIVIKTLEGIL